MRNGWDMRVVLQRVSAAHVQVGEETTGRIDRGLLALVGVEQEDGAEDVCYCVEKTAHLRVFPDTEGKMNLDILEAGGAVLAVSQFTLSGDVRKGRRPSFIRAARPETANPLYEQYCDALRALGLQVETGVFQAHMDIHMVGDGPVTLLVDSRRTF